jgi:glycosyltransferase involved in cell wall biosynthesis
VRVLFAAHQFFPEHRAGTEVLTLGLAKALTAQGHEAAVFAAKRSAPFSDLSPYETEDYEFEGIPVRRAGRPHESLSRPFHLNYDNPGMARGLTDFARDFRPDVVHFMHLQGLSAAAVPAVKGLGVPAVYTATDFWAVCPVVDLRRHDGVMCEGPDPAHCPRCLASRQRGSRVAEAASRIPGPLWRAAGAVSELPLQAMSLPLRQVRDLSERPARIVERVNLLDRVIAPVRLTGELLARNGVDRARITVSAYGIDLSGSRRTAKRCPDGAARFGFVGTLAPHKGCDLLVRAFGSLSDANVTLTFHGSGGEEFGEYETELRSLVNGDARISFAGLFPREKLWEVLSGIDVLVVPSRWYENSPVVIYEAFAAGVPVIATDLGGMSEVVEDGKNGLLFGLNDERALTDCLRRLIEEPGLVGRLRVGVPPVKSVEESAVEMEGLYEEIRGGAR